MPARTAHPGPEYQSYRNLTAPGSPLKRLEDGSWEKVEEGLEFCAEFGLDSVRDGDGDSESQGAGSSEGGVPTNKGGVKECVYTRQMYLISLTHVSIIMKSTRFKDSEIQNICSRLWLALKLRAQISSPHS